MWYCNWICMMSAHFQVGRPVFSVGSPLTQLKWRCRPSLACTEDSRTASSPSTNRLDYEGSIRAPRPPSSPTSPKTQCSSWATASARTWSASYRELTEAQNSGELHLIQTLQNVQYCFWFSPINLPLHNMQELDGVRECFRGSELNTTT